MRVTNAAEKKDLKEEMKRRNTRRMTMLAAFKKYGELNTKQLNHFGTGCSSRLKELRKEGHAITTHYESPGQYRYVYLGDKSDDDTKVSTVD